MSRTATNSLIAFTRGMAVIVTVDGQMKKSIRNGSSS